MELGHALGLVPEPFPDAHLGHNYEYTGSWITVPPFSGLTPLCSPERKVIWELEVEREGERRPTA